MPYILQKTNNNYIMYKLNSQSLSCHLNNVSQPKQILFKMFIPLLFLERSLFLLTNKIVNAIIFE